MSNEIVISSGSIFFLSGSATSSNVFKEIIEKPQTVAAKWEIDPVDGKSIQLRIPSSSAGTNFDRIAFYISGSGKIGIGTKDPQSAFDIRDIGEELNVKVKSIKPLDLKYRFSPDDPHYRKEGNKNTREHIKKGGKVRLRADGTLVLAVQ